MWIFIKFLGLFVVFLTVDIFCVMYDILCLMGLEDHYLPWISAKHWNAKLKQISCTVYCNNQFEKGTRKQHEKKI